MEFFEEIQGHSEVKLVALEKFVIPYIRKVFYDKYNKNNGRIILFDGFAGPGEYKAGDKGSPLRCLEAAIVAYLQYKEKKSKDFNEKEMKLSLYFCEKDKDNYLLLCNKIEQRIGKASLVEEKYKVFEKFQKGIEVVVLNHNFSTCFKRLISKRKKDWEKDPCFSFIDPFGYKDINLNEVIEFAKIEKTDIILNMIYEHLNRFLTVENNALNDTHKNFLGANDEEFRELQTKIKYLNGYERNEVITDFYKEKLVRQGLKVTKMKIKKDNKVKMILFYIGKNKEGLSLFKEIILEIETILEKKDRNCLLIKKEDLLKQNIKIFLLENYCGVVKYEKILEEIKNHEIYPESLFKKVLKELNKANELEIFDKNNKRTFKNLKATKIKFKRGENE